MKRSFREAAAVLLAASLCLSLTGCGISDIFKKKDTTEKEQTASPSATASSAESTATPAPEEDTSSAPAASEEPVKISILYENEEVSTLSFQTSTVIRLEAAASDGSTGGIWTSSDASAASVGENGVVTCWKIGRAHV